MTALETCFTTYSRRSMGKINRIQLRGISRTPSDRMTDDGGVAESLNVQLMDGEVAPMIEPEDVTEGMGLPDEWPVGKMFIHKTSSYENLIAVEVDAAEDINRIVYIKKGQAVTILEMGYREEVRDIVSVGNTLIIATSEHMRYALFVNGAYKYLGERIPEPQIEFRTNGVVEEKNRTADFDLAPFGTEFGNVTPIYGLDPSAWEQAVRDIRSGVETDDTKELLGIQAKIWERANKLEIESRRNGIFTRPMLVRYAIELYDGTYIYQSVPVILGAGHDKWLEAIGRGNYIEVGDLKEFYSRIHIELNKGYKAVAKLITWDTSGWEDIIKRVSLFLSTDISYPAVNANISGLSVIEEIDQFGDFKCAVDFFNKGKTDLQAMEDEILSKSNFYKIASFSTSEVSKLEDGYDIREGEGMLSQDTLVTQERLPDYEQSGTEILPSKLSVFNGRVLAAGGERRLPNGYGFLQSTNVIAEGQASKAYAFAFFISGSDGVRHKIVTKGWEGDEMLQPYSFGGSFALPYGLIFFPDSRCNLVSIWLGGGDVADIEMKPHPLMNCSYAFWGLSKTIEENNGASAADVTWANFIGNENRIEKDTQRLYQSQVNNPFYFPLSGNYMLQSNVIGIAVANTALSQGQFGQFPLYVFTSEGIWAMETGTDGSFVSQKPLSREVCVNPDSITPIDQAVIFVTDKGVAHLQGSQITELSPNMNGRHYMIEEGAKVIINGQDFFSDLLPSLSDNTPFLAFVKSASVAYDYPGRRIFFIKRDEKYQYVYKLDTRTWHKMTTGMEMVSSLNSYPEALVQASNAGRARILNLSTILDTSKKQYAERGVIATRPFDLGEPDVYKTITDVRVRGQFAKGAVKFILLGSNDGINFATVNTLRGRAWKLFRMIILADLEPTERISWVDVMYDAKFTNKLR